MKILHRILLLLLLAALSPTLSAQTLFRYPTVPDSIQTLAGRCDYLAAHFWDYCDLSKALSARQKLGEEFTNYLNIIQNGTPAAASAGLDALLHQLDKRPKDQLYLAEIAEAKLYSDSAEIWNDPLYLTVAQTIAQNRKIDKASKARFAHQADILSKNLIGQTAPSLPYTDPDGQTHTYNPADTATMAPVTILYFNDPECSDCALARIRLHADIALTNLIQKGTVRLLSISLTDPTPEWLQTAKTYPPEWTIAAAPDADMIYDLRGSTPQFYVLNSRNQIHFKHLNVDQILDITRQLNQK